MVEFRADPDLPSHNVTFSKGKKVVLYCGSGGRAVLAGKTLQEMGYRAVFNAGRVQGIGGCRADTEPA